MRRAARVFLALQALVMGFQVALILGAPWGALTMAGRWPGALPVEGRVGAAVSILILALFGRIVAEAGGLARRRLPPRALWAVVIFLGLGVLLHILTPSASERALWLPVIAVQLACTLRLMSQKER